jgi:transposase
MLNTKEQLMKYYAGLDVSMKETSVCILSESGQIVHKGRVKTDPEKIADQLKKTGFLIEKAGIESGSLSHWLVDELKKLEVAAICIDSRQMAAILSVQVNKTDDNDAKGIAEAMRCNLYREVFQKTQRSIEIGTLLASRRLIVTQKVQMTNAIRGLLKSYGVRLGSTGKAGFVEATKKAMPRECALAVEGIESLLLCYERLVEELKKLTRTVESIAKQDEDATRLMTIPGVGPITAVSYKMSIGDPKRFKNSKAVGAYLGMTPRQYSSGETVKQGRISKCGSGEMRFLLMEAGLILLTRSRKWSKLKAWGLKVLRKHGTKKAAMAVGRKLAVIMHRMMLDKTDFIYGESRQEKLASKTSEKPKLLRAVG